MARTLTANRAIVNGGSATKRSVRETHFKLVFAFLRYFRINLAHNKHFRRQEGIPEPLKCPVNVIYAKISRFRDYKNDVITAAVESRLRVGFFDGSIYSLGLTRHSTDVKL